MSNEDINRDDDNWPLSEELEKAYRSGNVADTKSDGSGRECGTIRETQIESISEDDGTKSDSQGEEGKVADTEGSDIKSLNEGQGQGESGRCDNGTQFGTGENGNDTSERQSGQGESEIEPQVGGNSDGITIGMVLSEYSGLSYQELEEIFDWMCSGTSRVEELRLLGNGVVPQCAEKAFRTLYARLDKAL